MVAVTRLGHGRVTLSFEKGVVPENLEVSSGKRLDIDHGRVELTHTLRPDLIIGKALLPYLGNVRLELIVCYQRRMAQPLYAGVLFLESQRCNIGAKLVARYSIGSIE